MINYKLSFRKPTIQDFGKNCPFPCFDISDEDYKMHLDAMFEDIGYIKGVLDTEQDKDGGLIVTTDGITEEDFFHQLFLLRDRESRYLTLKPIIKR